MNTRVSITLIFLGAILLFVGVAGVPGLQFALGAPENYTLFTEVDPNSNIAIVSSTLISHAAKRNEDAYLFRRYQSFSDFTMKVKFKCTSPGSSGVSWVWAVTELSTWKGFDVLDCDPAGFGLMFYNGVRLRLYFGTTGTPGIQEITVTANKLYSAEIVRSSATVTCRVFDGATLVGTMVQADITGFRSYRYIWACATTNYGVGFGAYTQICEMSELETTATPEGGVPPPTTGNLFVRGYADGNPVAFTAYHTSTSGMSPVVNVPTSGYTWSGLTTGTYTVYGTYAGNTISSSTSVNSGQTASVTLTFSGSPVTFTMTVKAKYNSGGSWLDFLGVPVTISGQAVQYTPTTFTLSSGTYTVTVPSTHATYTFYQWENGAQGASRSVGLTQNVEIVAYYSSGAAPPPAVDWLDWLKGVLSDPLVKSLFTMTGFGCVGIGVITLIPKGKKHYPAYPPQSW